MNHWIDIHSHILPAVDDGAANLQQTVHMLEIAHKEGIKHMIATPHYGVYYQNPDAEELKSKLELVRQEAAKIDENFRIDLGNELFYSDEIIDHLQMKKALTLADSRYVLVEFLYSENYNNIKAGLYKLLMNGYLPILAHVERYECLYQDVGLIEDLIKMGVLMQMNISSILGGITKRKASLCKKLMKKSLVHFIGTDSHSDEERAPRMLEGAAFISKKYGEATVNRLLVENTAKLLQNKPIGNGEEVR